MHLCGHQSPNNTKKHQKPKKQDVKKAKNEHKQKKKRPDK